MTDKLIIFDTTLRDGEQSPGASMTRDEKLRIARQLERLRVDVIEAGFAASSNGDFEAVKSIAMAIRESIVCSLARANDRDISRAAEALKGAARARIHTFIATSELHMEKKLRMTRDQVFEQAKLSVRFARNLCDDVEFSPEDGYRSDPDYLCRVLEAVITEGATTINIPDTVGYAIPELYGEFIRSLRERVPNAHKAVWSVHCHNDLGMAVANSLAGVKIGGARQIECTINGLGERAGNCALEEVVKSDGLIFLATQKNPAEDDPSTDDIYEIGTLATVLQLLKLPDSTVKVLVEGVGRARTAAQIFSALSGAAFFLLFQAQNILGRGAVSELGAGLNAFVSAVRENPNFGPSSIVWYPARSLFLEPLPTVLFLGLSSLVFVWTVNFTRRSFLRGVQNESKGDRRTRASNKTVSFSGGLFLSLYRKEWRSILRDPLLISQTLLQLLYLIPAFFVVLRPRDDGTTLSSGLLALSLNAALVFISGTLVSNLARIAISAEDAPDLLRMSPRGETPLNTLKMWVIVLPIFGKACFWPSVCWLSWVHRSRARPSSCGFPVPPPERTY